jgi:glutathione S-transferase
VLKVEKGFINETSVILEYLEQTQSGPALLPGDAFQRAPSVGAVPGNRVVHRTAGPRLLWRGVLWHDGTAGDQGQGQGRVAVGDCITGPARQVCAVYVAGESFTLADLFFMYSVDLACAVGGKLFGLDLLAELPKAKALLKKLQDLPNAQRVAADKEAAMPAFMAMVAAKKS